MEGEGKRDLSRKGLLIMTDQSVVFFIYRKLSKRGKQGLKLVGFLQYKAV